MMNKVNFPAVTNMILLEKPIGLKKDALENAVELHGLGADISVVTQQPDQPGTFVVLWNGVAYAVMEIDQPVPQEAFQNATHHSFTLSHADAQDIVKKQKAHIIVSPITQADDMNKAVFNAMGLTELTSIIAQIQTPVGYYWSHADTLIDQKQFEEGLNGVREAMVRQIDKEPNAGSTLPKMMWVGYRFFTEPGTKNIGAYTYGLLAFTGFEIQISPLPWDAPDVGERLVGVVGHVFTTGPYLERHQTVGMTEDEKFRVQKVDGTEKMPPHFILTLEEV